MPIANRIYQKIHSILLQAKSLKHACGDFDRPIYGPPFFGIHKPSESVLGRFATLAQRLFWGEFKTLAQN